MKPFNELHASEAQELEQQFLIESDYVHTSMEVTQQGWIEDGMTQADADDHYAQLFADWYNEKNKNKTLYNTCITCKEKWQVLGNNSHLSYDDINLAPIDHHNIKHHGQLYSVCEDCSPTSECEPILKEVTN